jgi:hypothetical protein
MAGLHRRTLQRLYIKEKLSVVEVAKRVGMSERTVRSYMRKHGILLRPKPLAEERFYDKILIGVPPNGCWEWQGALTEAGYGEFMLNRKPVYAHRHCYELLVGPVPKRKELDHLCRNRKCCNPAHLEPVTRKVNAERGAWAMRTHCKNGHAFTPENTAYWGKHGRSCKACHRNRMSARYHRLKAA